jgi:aminoglycoside phosphotransferase (APT) family kinase protein
VLTPLSGGVCSDIFKVEIDDGRTVVAKRLLARMRVTARWSAPADRAAREADWLKLARDVGSHLAPRVIAEAAGGRLFVMEYLDPAIHPVWKNLLLAGEVDIAFAGAVGASLARIHTATAGRAHIAARFAGDETFQALRIAPFLLHAASRHPDVAPIIRALARELAARKIALVHGDVSPKNILAGPKGPVFLDAETVVFGDPAFDLAFCLSHLLLKALWVRTARKAMLEAFDALRSDYLAGVAWEPSAGLEGRAAPLLGALLLARVDGKSPAPYLTDPADQDFVRRQAKAFLRAPDLSLTDMARIWSRGVAEMAA